MEKTYAIRLLLIGILLTAFGISRLSTIWTTKSALKEIKGTLHYANTYLTKVSGRTGGSSQRSELIFYLNGLSQKYTLVENIGNDNHDDKYDNILQELKMADSISVWIRKNENDKDEPKVFQISSEKGILLDLTSVTDDGKLATFAILLLGIASLFGYFWIRNPDKFKSLFGNN